ncbi:MAG: histidine phosphatase family protein [Pirellulales bacterium]
MISDALTLSFLPRRITEMLRLVLIRPGHSLYEAQGRVQGNLDIPLADEARAAVRELAVGLRDSEITAIYSNPCSAAVETAKALAAEFGVKPRSLDELQNVNHGLWQGLLIEDIREKQPYVYKQWQERPENVCPPGGEMLGDAAERIEEGLDWLIKKHRHGGTVGIVVGEPMLSLIRSKLTGAEVGDLWKAAAAPPGAEIFEVDPVQWRKREPRAVTPVAVRQGG